MDGGAGNDSVIDDASRDMLGGGDGRGDRLWGGAGADRLMIRRGDGAGAVEDSRPGDLDRFDLRDFAPLLGAIDSLVELRAAGRVASPQYGGDTLITLVTGDVFTVQYVNAS